MNIYLPYKINGEEYEIDCVDVSKDDDNNYTINVHARILKSIDKVETTITITKPCKNK